MKKIAVGSLIFGTVVAVCAGCQGERSVSGGAAADPADALTVVQLVPVERTTIRRQTTQPAVVHAYYQSEINAKTAGYLKELHVDIGSRVTAGQTLAVLDVPEVYKQRERQQALIRRLEADEKRAAAEIEVQKSNVQSAESLREEARADIQRSSAQLAADEAEWKRVTDLVKSDSVASRLLDEATQRRDAARAAKSVSEASLASAEANVLVARSKLAAAQAEQETALAATEVARKQLEELEILIGYATLKAPFAGVITQRHVDPGDLVKNVESSGGDYEPLFVVAQVDSMRVRVALPERETTWADVGDAATIRLQALPGLQLEGKVDRVSSSLDEGTRSMMVEIDLPNPDLKLLPGMFGDATLVLEVHQDCLVLPASAVRHNQTGGSFVYVINANDEVEVIDVTTGLDSGDQIEIVNGLHGDERVAGATVSQLQAGQKVNIGG